MLRSLLVNRLLARHAVSGARYMLLSCDEMSVRRPSVRLSVCLGTLNSHEWKTREWKTRHHTAVVENAGLENTAP